MKYSFILFFFCCGFKLKGDEVFFCFIFFNFKYIYFVLIFLKLYNKIIIVCCFYYFGDLVI